MEFCGLTMTKKNNSLSLKIIDEMVEAFDEFKKRKPLFKGK